MSAEPEVSSTAPRVLASFLVARAAFGLVFLGVALGAWRIPWYLPLERRWVFEVRPEGLAMGWFGATGAALAAAIAAGGIAWVASARGALARVVARRHVVPAMARAFGLVVLLDFAYFGWTLTHQTPATRAEPDAAPSGSAP